MSELNVNKAVLGYLQEFGLNDKEITIYLTLLKSGPSTIMDLARKTDIKRSTTHNNVEELIKKGLVSQTNHGERRMVVAENPEKLKFLLEQRKWEVSRLETNMDEIVKEIFQIVPKARENTHVDVKYYTGKEGTSLIYRDAFAAKELRSYVNLTAASKIFPENSAIYLNSQKKNRNLKVKELIDNSDESIKIAKHYEKNSNFNFKISSKPLNLTTIDTLLYDGKVAFINFRDDSITGTVIDNNDYYNNNVVIFDLIWDLM